MLKNHDWTQSPKPISPGTAGLLALIPFLGAIYNGTYFKALQQFATLCLIVVLADAMDLEGLGVFGGLLFYLYTIVDAVRTARLIERGVPAEQPGRSLSIQPVMVQGGLLILVGGLLLLHNLDLFSLAWVGRFWPLLLVAAGIYLVWAHWRPAPDARDNREAVTAHRQPEPPGPLPPLPDAPGAEGEHEVGR